MPFGDIQNNLKKESFWGSWCPFECGHRFTALSLEETLMGGQSFDWHPIANLHWRGRVERNIFECRWQNGEAEWRCQKKTVHPEELIEKYFCLGAGYEALLNELPWRSDPILGLCMKQLDGLRILRQPLDQTLFFFILSSAKSIPQIQAIGEAVFQRYGDELMAGIYSFPGWAKLAEIPEEDLRVLKMG